MTKRWMSLGLVGAAAVIAVGAGAVAVNAASPGTGRTVMSEDDVARQLAAQPPAATATGPALSAAAVTKTVSSEGGTIVAACQDDQAALLRWTPKVGGEVHNLHAGPGTKATITFEIGDREVFMVATCANGVPQVIVRADDRGGDNPQPEPSDDHGGNRGGGSGGPGGGSGGADDPPGHH